MRKALVFLLYAFLVNCLNADTSNTTTTEKPPTSSDPPQPTTLPPPQPEVAENLHFEIMNPTDNQTICSMFNFTASITIRNLNKTEIISQIVVPLTNSNTKMNKKSSCNSNVTNLVLDITTLNNSAVLQFELNHAESHYELTLIQLDLDGTKFIKNGTSVHVEDSKSYLCFSHPEFELTEQKESSKDLKKDAILSTTELRIDAFRSQKEPNQFRAAMECQYDFPNNDFVPLAVGCALISLVFIVLIAYIVGRKRSRRLTYQSV